MAIDDGLSDDERLRREDETALRDYFAGQALTSLVDMVGGSEKAAIAFGGDDEFCRFLASKSYSLADAMMHERAKGMKP